MIRAAWVLLAGALLTFFHASLVVLRSFRPRGITPCECENAARVWCRHILRLAGVEVRVEGAENLPRGEARIVVCNHQSWFDVFAIAAELPASVRFVAKQELGRIPIFGRAWQVCGHVSVDRADRASAIASLENAGQRIRDESLTIVMFPEGTRSPTGRLQRFKKGAFVLAIQTGVPVVPVAIHGTHRVMPKGSWKVSPGRVEIRIGEPIPVEGLGHQDRDRVAARGEEAVRRLLEGPDRLGEAGQEGGGHAGGEGVSGRREQPERSGRVGDR